MKQKLFDFSSPIDLNTEIAMRVIHPDLMKINLKRNIKEDSVGHKQILIPIGNKNLDKFISFVTILVVLISVYYIFISVKSIKIRSHKK